MHEKLVIEFRYLRKNNRSKRRDRKRRHYCLTPKQLDRALADHQDQIARGTGRTTFIVLRKRFFLVDETHLFCSDWSKVTEEEKAQANELNILEWEMTLLRDARRELFNLTKYDFEKIASIVNMTERIDSRTSRSKKKATLQINGNVELQAKNQRIDELIPIVKNIHQKVKWPMDSINTMFAQTRQSRVINIIPQALSET